MTRVSVFVAIILTLVVHHFLRRRALAAGAAPLRLGGKVRRWFDAAAIAVLGTLLLFGAIHWLGILSRGHA
jgi:hypothetical protein